MTVERPTKTIEQLELDFEIARIDKITAEELLRAKYVEYVLQQQAVANNVGSEDHLQNLLNQYRYLELDVIDAEMRLHNARIAMDAI